MALEEERGFKMTKNDISYPLVVSGPSGVGKSTLLKRLFAEYPDHFGFSVSHTTRQPRAGEVDSKTYHFTDREGFEDMIQQNKFIEHAVFSGNRYGTSIQAIENVKATGKRCILDIDSQGVRLVKASQLEPFYLFIAPPSFPVLQRRLTERGTEGPESVAARLAAAEKEIEYAQEPGVHDAFVENDDLERAYEVFKNLALGHTSEGDPFPENLKRSDATQR